MHVNTHSVHNRFLKPWWGHLLCSLPSRHVFLPPLYKLNWRSLTPNGGPGPPTPKMASPSTGSAHTPFSVSKTITFDLMPFCLYFPFDDLSVDVFFIAGVFYFYVSSVNDSLIMKYVFYKYISMYIRVQWVYELDNFNPWIVQTSKPEIRVCLKRQLSLLSDSVLHLGSKFE
jgi:hypothetical protein